MDHRAADAQRRLSPVLELLDRQHAVHVDDLVEMPHHAVELPLDVAAQGRGDVNVVAGELQLHDLLLLRSLDGGIPSASRYLATVRRATWIPSPDSISAIWWSDSGRPGGS